jgi:hypothetical protein
MSNLLKSNGGIELTPEVCLLVLDRAVMLDPKLAVDLMLVSKVGSPSRLLDGAGITSVIVIPKSAQDIPEFHP